MFLKIRTIVLLQPTFVVKGKEFFKLAKRSATCFLNYAERSVTSAV